MRVLILGTGTSVGKTYVTARLAAALRAQGRVRALKPIETGVAPGETGDAGLIAAAAGHAPVLSSWRFPRAVSPHLAARDVGATLDVDAIAAWVAREALSGVGAITLIESAGGAFSPLGQGTSNVELAAALEPALWLLVAPDSLGVLHDLRATLGALPRPPDGVLLSAARPPDDSSGSNGRELRELGVSDVLAELGPGASAEGVARWLLARPTFKSS